jgi:hypothetical protein
MRKLADFEVGQLFSIASLVDEVPQCALLPKHAKTKKADNNQVNCHDVVQQPWDEKNQNTGQ